MNGIYFMLGVFIGNIIDIKYVFFIGIIYIIIKNEPIYDVYPRDVIKQFIIQYIIKLWNTKNKVVNKSDKINIDNNINKDITDDYYDQGPKIEEIGIYDKSNHLDLIPFNYYKNIYKILPNKT